MSTIHAVKGCDEDGGLTIRLYKERDCGYPCFTEVGTLVDNGDAVRRFGHHWELNGTVGGKQLIVTIPSPDAVGDLFIGCDWPALEEEVERRIADIMPYVEAVIFETRDEYDAYVLASKLWFYGEGYYCAQYSEYMKKVWYVREFEEMLDIVNDHLGVGVLLDSDIERLEDDGWSVVYASGKITAIIRTGATE